MTPTDPVVAGAMLTIVLFGFLLYLADRRNAARRKREAPIMAAPNLPRALALATAYRRQRAAERKLETWQRV